MTKEQAAETLSSADALPDDLAIAVAPGGAWIVCRLIAYGNGTEDGRLGFAIWKFKPGLVAGAEAEAKKAGFDPDELRGVAQ